MVDEEEDDYMNFAIPETAPSKNESSLQRRARLKKEGEERGRILPKAEKEAKAKADRDAALATKLDDSNKGAKMMAKMGFKGGALGKSEDARTTPIELLMKDDKGGIGMDSEKKRKVREAAEAAEEGEKRQKVGFDEFRERNRSEQEEKRAEGQLWGAMKVMEGFEEGEENKPGEVGNEEVKQCGEAGRADEEVEQGEARSTMHTGDRGTADRSTSPDIEKTKKKKKKKNHLRDVNILYRPLIRQRLQKSRDRKMRHEMDNSLSMRNETASDDEDKKQADFDPRTDELDDEDPALAEFEELPLTVRLEKVVAELREKYQYCFWCKYRYPDVEMEGCPGLTEDEHG